MLLLDVGNSRCKWARIENGVWTRRGVVDNAEWQSLQSHFDLLLVPSRIIISNVAGDLMAQQLRHLCAKWAVPLEFVRAQSKQSGVTNRYENPSQLGSDRWVALIAAWHQVKGACLVVNCGTATTIDALSEAGEFIGGLIVPGMTLMQHSLAKDTALLQKNGGQLNDFPRNTADAIYSGAIRATIGAIAQQYELLIKMVVGTSGSFTCVLSGGASGLIENQLGMPVVHVDNLVLEGLKIIGDASA